MISKAHREAVEKRIRDDVAKINKRYNRDFVAPPVVYDVKGGTGGYVTPRDNYSRVHLNPEYFINNADEMINATTPHELAHWAEYKIYGGWERTRGGKRSVHGKRWKAIMKVLGADDSRCHNMDTTHVTRKSKTKYEYECSRCKARLTVGPVVHKKIQAGQARWHTGCNRAPLQYVGILGKVTYAEAAKKKGKKKVKESKPSQKRPTQERKTAPRAGGNANKKTRAHVIYRSENGNKAECINRFMTELNMSKAGATTYYYNCRKELS